MLLFTLVALFLGSQFAVAFGRKTDSPCESCLANIVAQPENPKFDFLKQAANNVPKYDWFSGSITSTAAQFYSNNFVGVVVTDAFGQPLVAVMPDGSIFDVSAMQISFFRFDYDYMKAGALNIRTHYQSNAFPTYAISQTVRDAFGQLLFVTVMIADGTLDFSQFMVK